MRIKEFDVNLDIKKPITQERFEVVQGDSGSNLLRISLVDGLEPYDLTGTNIEIVFRKPDGKTVQETEVPVISEQGGSLQCLIKTNIIACPGSVEAEVRVLDGDALLTSARFSFYVRKALMNDEAVESTNEFPILNQLIEEAGNMIERIEHIERQVPEDVVERMDSLEMGMGHLKARQASYSDKDTGTGTYISTDKADNALVDIVRIEGESKQVVTVQGKNLFDGILEQGGFNPADGSLSNNTARVRSKNYTRVTAGTYAISFGGAQAWVMYVYDLNNTFVSSKSIVGWQQTNFIFTLDATYNIKFAFAYLDNTAIAPADVTQIQLEPGSTATPYAPFVPNSPSPDYPSPIFYPDGTGKNLFDGVMEQGAYVTPGGAPSASATRVRSKNYIMVDEGEYVISFTGGTSFALYVYDMNGSVILSESLTGWQTNKIFTIVGRRKIKIVIRNNDLPIVPGDVGVKIEKPLDVVSSRGKRNLLRNSDYNSDIAGWGSTGNSTISREVNSPGGLFPSGARACLKNVVTGSTSGAASLTTVVKLLKKDTLYTVSGWIFVPVESAGDYRFRAYYDTSGWVVISNGIDKPVTKGQWMYAKHTFRTNAAESRTVITFGTTSASVGESFYITLFKVEEGEADTPWTPAPEDIPYNVLASGVYKIKVPHPFVSLPNGVRNTIEEIDGEIWFVERVREVFFDGSADEGWSMIAAGGVPNTGTYKRFMVPAPLAKTSFELAYSSHFKPATWNWGTASGNIDTGANQILVINNSIRVCAAHDDANSFKAWLAANPITVQYELAAPIVTPVSKLILKSFEGITHVFSDPAVNMTVNFKSRLWADIYEVKRENETLKNAIIALGGSL